MFPLVVNDNRLTIPTSFKAGQIEIAVRGSTTLSIGWARADENVKYVVILVTMP